MSGINGTGRSALTAWIAGAARATLSLWRRVRRSPLSSGSSGIGRSALIEVVSATRHTEAEFSREAPLDVSLARLRFDPRLSFRIM